MQIHILGIVLLAVTLNTARAGEYLTEKPDALETCLKDDENRDICTAKTIHNTIINWADGIPGKDIFGLTDPFTLDDFNVTREISADDGTPSVIQIQYSNFSVKGLSQGVITRARYFDSFITATLEIPKLVLNFKLNATINEGSKTTEIADKVQAEMSLFADFDAYFHERHRSNATFWYVKNMRIGIYEVLDFSLQTQTDFDKSMYKYLMDSKNDVSGFLKTWDRHWGELLLRKRVNKILNYIPAEFIVDRYF